MAVKSKRRMVPKVTLHVVSDATGNLASHMLHAVLTQFPGLDAELVFHLFQDDTRGLEQELGEIRGKGHLVVHALLDPSMKAHADRICATKRIPAFDLTGALVQFIADHTRVAPANELSRLHDADEGYFNRIEAMEFTAQHDDNRRLDSIDEADIVIVGLSRVSKSPTSTWLGAKGFKVANVAIAREVGFPEELDKVMRRTVAFTCRPKDLFEIRKRRFEGFQKEIEAQEVDDLPYYDLKSVVREVSWANREFKKRGYPIIDITGQTVEELAALVLTDLKIKSRDLFYMY